MKPECIHCIFQQVDHRDLELDRITIHPGPLPAKVGRLLDADPAAGLLQVGGHIQPHALQHIDQVQTTQAGICIAQNRLDLVGGASDPAGLLVQDPQILVQTREAFGIATVADLMLQALRRQAKDAQGLIDLVGDGRGFQAHLEAMTHLVQCLLISDPLLLEQSRDLLFLG